MRFDSKLIGRKPNDKHSEREDRPLRKKSQNNVVTLDGVEQPKSVLNVLPVGPKHSIRDKFNEVQFLSDVD